MKLKTIINMDRKYYMNTFGERIPVCFKRGKGIKLWDIEGRKYYDFLAGIAVNALGHSHPRLVKAIKSQAGKYIHCSSLYYIKQQAKLAKMLVDISCADRVFFSNSGAESNEGAIKMARLFFRKRGEPGRYEIVTLDKSFHGRTLTTLAATGQEKYQDPFRPITPGFRHVPINNIDALEDAVTGNTCAVMLEPVQGEGGVNLLSPSYITEVRKLCDMHGILLILDEIQTGLGRTGRMFCYEHFNIEPDIFTLAKALGGGVPIGAICARGDAAEVFSPGDHGSTFGGNPLACSAAVAVLETIKDELLVENAAIMGEYFLNKLKALQQKHSLISEVRGMGLMIGIQLESDKAVEVRDACFSEGYLTGNVGSSIVRVLPPLTVTTDDIDGMISVLDKVLNSIQEK